MTLFQWRIYTLFPLHRCWLTDGCVACQQRFGIVLFFSELLDFHHLASAPPTMIVMATYYDHNVVWLLSGAARRGLDTVEEPFCFPRLGSQVKTLNNFIYFYYLHSNTKVRRDNNGCLRWEARKIMSPTKTMCTYLYRKCGSLRWFCCWWWRSGGVTHLYLYLPLVLMGCDLWLLYIFCYRHNFAGCIFVDHATKSNVVTRIQ